MCFNAAALLLLYAQVAALKTKSQTANQFAVRWSWHPPALVQNLRRNLASKHMTSKRNNRV
jgi:hypothetical protein